MTGKTVNVALPTATVAPHSERGHYAEAAILLVISLLGISMNISVIVVIFMRRNLRKASNGLIVHQTILDIMKSIVVMPFSLGVLFQDERIVAKCHMFGAIYVILVTVTFLNILSLVLNDAPTFPDTSVAILDSHQCVIFGVVMVWFTGVLINVVPTLIMESDKVFASKPEYGQCAFIFGPLQNTYVLNILWTGFNYFIIGICAYQIYKLHRDMTMASNLEAMKVVSLVTTMLSVNSQTANTEHQRVQNYVQQLEKDAVRRLRTFTILLAIITIHWSPLFLVGLADIWGAYAPAAYKFCAFFACANTFTNPLVFLCLHKNIKDGATVLFCCHVGELELTEGGARSRHERPGVNVDRSSRERTERERARNRRYEGHGLPV